MSTVTSGECTYQPGQMACFNSACPRVCVRNFRDQSTGDVPLATLNGKGLRGRQPRRHRDPILRRWLATLRP